MKTTNLILNEVTGKSVTLRIPEAVDVLNLKVGDDAPNCFGGIRMVTAIFHRGEDRNGVPFVCYTVAMSDRDTIQNGCGCSSSMKVGELMRTMAATCAFKSADLDDVESYLNAGRELPAWLARGSRREAA